MESKCKSVAGEPHNSQSPSKRRKESTPIRWLDASALQAALDKLIISEWEHGFYVNNLGKDTLTEKQTPIKDLVDFKVKMNAAKEKKALSDFEYKFLVDIFGKEPSALSEKQLAMKQSLDTKVQLWRAFEASAISDWDLEFMLSNIKRDSWTPKQLPIKERIEKQIEAAAAVVEGEVLSEWEMGFFKDNAGKDYSALSDKQRPIMDRINKKLQAWRAFRAGLLSQWQLDFVKDVAGKGTLSEKQQSKLQEIEEKMGLPKLSDPHSSDEELADIALPVNVKQ